MKHRDPGLQQAIKVAGGPRWLALKLGISTQALANWRRVPADRIVQVEKVTGVPRETLRPELYRVRERA